MITFIGSALQLHFQLQSRITAHNRRLCKTPSVSFVYYERLSLHCGWLINSCGWPIHSFAKWFTLDLICPPFITFCKPCRDHLPEGFCFYCLCMHCHWNASNSMVTKSAVTGKCLAKRLASNERTLWFQYPCFQASCHNIYSYLHNRIHRSMRNGCSPVQWSVLQFYLERQWK
jgi:hypothetical protein